MNTIRRFVKTNNGKHGTVKCFFNSLINFCYYVSKKMTGFTRRCIIFETIKTMFNWNNPRKRTRAWSQFVQLNTYSCFALFSVLTSLIDFRINHERMKKRHWPGAICINLTSRSPNKKITKRNTKGLQNCTETELPSDIHSFNRFFFRLRQ